MDDGSRPDVADATHENVRLALDRAAQGVGSHLQGNAKMPVEDALTYARQFQADRPDLVHVHITKSGPWLHFHPVTPE